MCWDFQPAFFGVELTRVIGIVLIIVGAPGLLDSFARFALQGLGTPPSFCDTPKSSRIPAMIMYARVKAGWIDSA
jgi:hypothetical protein